MPKTPGWFRDGHVVTSNAPTCGINKDGLERFIVHPETGLRSGELDDELTQDVERVIRGEQAGGHIYVHPLDRVVESRVLVPQYFDMSTVQAARNEINALGSEFEALSLGELRDRGWIEVFPGHGSPSSDQRVGDIPYIKVSDLRGGTVNVNPTNMVPEKLAEDFWGGPESGLKPFDLISPARASKNIGEFCVLMPGQERIVLTREVFIVRVGKDAPFDQFFLTWAFALRCVRRQWDRVVLMQTNREDVGDRAYEIEVPVPVDCSKETVGRARDISRPFREYYEAAGEARRRFGAHVNGEGDTYHVFI